MISLEVLEKAQNLNNLTYFIKNSITSQVKMKIEECARLRSHQFPEFERNILELCALEARFKSEPSTWKLLAMTGIMEYLTFVFTQVAGDPKAQNLQIHLLRCFRFFLCIEKGRIPKMPLDGKKYCFQLDKKYLGEILSQFNRNDPELNLAVLYYLGDQKDRPFNIDLGEIINKYHPEEKILNWLKANNDEGFSHYKGLISVICNLCEESLPTVKNKDIFEFLLIKTVTYSANFVQNGWLLSSLFLALSEFLAANFHEHVHINRFYNLIKNKDLVNWYFTSKCGRTQHSLLMLIGVITSYEALIVDGLFTANFTKILDNIFDLGIEGPDKEENMYTISWIISNIVAGTIQQVQKTIDRGYMHKIASCVRIHPNRVKNEGVYALSNCVDTATEVQIGKLLSEGGLLEAYDHLLQGNFTAKITLLSITGVNICVRKGFLDAVRSVITPKTLFAIYHNKRIPFNQLHFLNEASDIAGNILVAYGFDLYDNQDCEMDMED